MIGTILKSKPRLYVRTLFFGMMSLALLFGAFLLRNEVTGAHLAILAIWPACLSIAFWTHRRKQYVVELKDEEIVSSVPGQEHIPYSTIIAVQAEQSQQRHYPLYLHHQTGVLTLPAGGSVPTLELQRFLTQFVPQDRYQLLSMELQAISQKHIDKFGAEKVFVFTPRLTVVKGIAGKAGRAFAFGTGYAGLFLIIGGPVAGGMQDHFNGAFWGGFGFFLIILGIFLKIIYDNDGTIGEVKKWKNSGVVISPWGLAIIQNKLRGEMKWDELKRLVFPTKRVSFETSRSTKPGSIRLDFGGGTVDIVDVYCHPLDTIHERIKGYWQG